jgi:hypothetical protein
MAMQADHEGRSDLHGAFEVDARFSLGGENVSGNS